MDRASSCHFNILNESKQSFSPAKCIWSFGGKIYGVFFLMVSLLDIKNDIPLNPIAEIKEISEKLKNSYNWSDTNFEDYLQNLDETGQFEGGKEKRHIRQRFENFQSKTWENPNVEFSKFS